MSTKIDPGTIIAYTNTRANVNVSKQKYNSTQDVARNDYENECVKLPEKPGVDPTRLYE